MLLILCSDWSMLLIFSSEWLILSILCSDWSGGDPGGWAAQLGRHGQVPGGSGEITGSVHLYCTLHLSVYSIVQFCTLVLYCTLQVKQRIPAQEEVSWVRYLHNCWIDAFVLSKRCKLIDCLEFKSLCYSSLSLSVSLQSCKSCALHVIEYLCCC